MAEALLGTNVIMQVGILVRDVEKTAAKWAEFLGVEMPAIELTGPVEDAQTVYRGKSTPARSKLAFLNAGQVQIELIEPDKAPSTWRQCLEQNGEGIHHIAFVIKDMKGNIKKLEDMGMTLMQTGEYTGGRYAYVDGMEQLKVMVELLEND